MLTRTLAIIPLLAALAGCAGTQHQTGVRVGDETLKQFKAGVTTQAWLVAILGPPTTWSDVEGIPQTQVYRYATGEESSGFFQSVLGRSTRNTAVTYFVITDGVVTRFWADRAIDYTLLGEPVERETGTKETGGGKS